MAPRIQRHFSYPSAAALLDAATDEDPTAFLFASEETDDNRQEEIWSVAAHQHAQDVATSLQSPLTSESLTLPTTTTPLAFEWRQVPAQILETSHPVLNAEERQLVLESAAAYWNQTQEKLDTSTRTTSRFTLQCPHKREMHAADLDPPAIKVLNHALETLYPLLRSAYLDKLSVLDPKQKQQWRLVPYDSLVIEYDATALGVLDERPAQPLHRDLGLVSLNIALDDPQNFEGGGTLFERLLEEETATVLPRAAGHALAHPCRERHAGRALLAGKRTIWVLFLTVAFVDESSVSHTCPKLELAARCKSLGAQIGRGETIPLPQGGRALNGIQDRMLTYRAALCADPTDGEAWLYLGMVLLEKEPPQMAVQALREAQRWNPADGRVYNTLGIALTATQDSSGRTQDEIREAYRTACRLFSRAAQAGCRGAAAEARSSLLNLGLWYANRDDFSDAAAVLRQICVHGPVCATETNPETPNETINNTLEDARAWEAKRIVKDARGLLAFCEKQIHGKIKTK